MSRLGFFFEICWKLSRFIKKPSKQVEFRQHKKASQKFIPEFIRQWEQYAEDLERDAKRMEEKPDFGKPISVDLLENDLTADQQMQERGKIPKINNQLIAINCSWGVSLQTLYVIKDSNDELHNLWRIFSKVKSIKSKH